MTRTHSILAELRAADVKVNATGDKLQLDAPAGTLTPALVERIRANKAELLAALKAKRALRPTSARLPAGLHQVIKAALQVFADEGISVMSVKLAPNVMRQRAGIAIREARRRGRIMRAIALRDAWNERRAICLADGMSAWEASRIAADEVALTDTG